MLALRSQEKREIAIQTLGMLKFLRKLYYGDEFSLQEVEAFKRFFTHRRYTQEEHQCMGYDRVRGQVRAFIEFFEEKRRLEAEVTTLKVELRALRSTLKALLEKERLRRSAQREGLMAFLKEAA